jgi:hypothetical protein
MKKGDDYMKEYKDNLIYELIENGIFKTDDGRHLYELEEDELQLLSDNEDVS